MFLMPEIEVEQIIRRRHVYLAVGLSLCCLQPVLPQGWRIGFFSGFMLFSIGIYGVVFRRWRTDAGLWMLAALLTVMLGSCWAYFEWQQWRGWFVPPAANQPVRALNWDQARFLIDATVALLLLTKVIRFATTVAIANWKWSRLVRRIRRSRRNLGE
jgi:hypothetical protein